MRVALVAESFLPRVNGVSNSVIRVARYLHGAGHEAMIVAPDSYTGESFENMPVSRIPSLAVPGIHETDVAYGSSEQLARAIQRFDPDVVHLASPFALGHMALRALQATRVPTVAVFQTDVAGFAEHYGLSAVSFLADAWIRRLHRRVDLTLVPSSDSERYLSRLGVDRVARWGRGVDTEMFHPGWRETALYPGVHRTVVGYVGRLAPEKNVDILRILAQDPDIQLVIIGDGPERAELETALPNAIFTGLLRGETLSRHIASLDVLVAPGERETFCQVIQEGMAAGLPVVAPAVGGPRDLVVPGETGFLYPPGDASAMRAGVRTLAASAHLRATMGVSARALVAGRTWPAVCAELVGHYEAVIEQRTAVAV